MSLRLQKLVANIRKLAAEEKRNLPKRKKKSSWTNPHRPLKFQWSKRFLGKINRPSRFSFTNGPCWNGGEVSEKGILKFPYESLII